MILLSLEGGVKRGEDHRRNERSVGCGFLAGNGVEGKGRKDRMESPGSAQRPGKRPEPLLAPLAHPCCILHSSCFNAALPPQASESTPRCSQKMTSPQALPRGRCHWSIWTPNGPVHPVVPLGRPGFKSGRCRFYG